MAEVSPASRTVRFGAYELDLRTAQLKKHGLRVKLQRQPAQILVFLVSKPGEVLTREQLRGHLWSDDTFVDFDHGLNNSINRIREVLCDSVTEPASSRLSLRPGIAHRQSRRSGVSTNRWQARRNAPSWVRMISSEAARPPHRLEYESRHWAQFLS